MGFGVGNRSKGEKTMVTRMTTPDIDLDALEAAALAAMPGPFDSESYVPYVTANPAVVLELIRRLRAAEGAMK